MDLTITNIELKGVVLQSFDRVTLLFDRSRLQGTDCLDEHRIVLLSPHTAVEGLDISREHRSPRSALQLCDYYENVFRCSFLA